VDNLCHTLVGAALAESGLKRRSALATATLMIGANFPDIDVVAVPLGHGLGFRRGITHGVPALVVLPVVLTAIMLAWARLRPPNHGSPRVVPGQLLLLSVVSVLTHPVLDWMNTYGMRWLMPLSGRWWYGDSLFIVDPWILLALSLGIWLSRRRARLEGHGGVGRARQASWGRSARLALAAVALYIGGMMTLTSVGRARVTDALRRGNVRFTQVMIAPVPLNPVARRVVIEVGGQYQAGDLRWTDPAVVLAPGAIAKNGDDAAAAAANATPAGREFLSWARLPFWVADSTSDSVIVHIGDARYTSTGRESWASVRIALPVR
jgi:inner membrane protein